MRMPMAEMPAQAAELAERSVQVRLAQPSPRKPRGRLLGLVLAALAAALGLGIYYRYQPVSPSQYKAAPEVRVARVRSGVVEKTLRLTGTTAAERSAYLRAPYMRGRRSRGGGASDFRLVLQDLIPAGTRVKQGDVVAAFDRQFMLNRLDDDRAERADIEANVKKMLALLDVTRTAHRQKIRTAKGNMDKAALNLRTAPVRSAIRTELFRLAFEESQMQYDALRRETKYIDISETAQIRNAQLNLKEADVELRRAQANVDRMVVRAPIDRLAVVQDTFRGGEFSRIRAGDEVHPGQVFLQIVEPGSMMVEAKVNQADVERLRIGARARVRFDAFAGLELPGRVFSVSPMAAGGGWRASYVREVPVYLRLERTDPRVIPSLSVSAAVVLDSEESDAVVPLESVFRDEKGGMPFGFVQGPGGWERRDLDLGLAGNLVVAVRSGLGEGDVVAAGRPPEAR